MYRMRGEVLGKIMNFPASKRNEKEKIRPLYEVTYKGVIKLRNRHNDRDHTSNNAQKKKATSDFSSIQQDPTPEENPKYGSKSHKN